jgi:amino acid adenylation domain-containing protein
MNDLTACRPRDPAPSGANLPAMSKAHATPEAIRAQGPNELDWMTIPRVPRAPQGDEAEFPLSFAQQRLWFLDRLTPGKWYYNIPSAVRVSSRLSIPLLQRTLDEMIRRHESLRTVFRAKDGVPTQVVLPHMEIPIQTLDISNLTPVVRGPELTRRINEEARHLFDLTQGPLLRLTLICVDNADHAIVATMHHIISDGWSLNVFWRELGVIYEAYASGREHSLPPQTLDYPDFAVWQRERLTGRLMEEQINWWRQRLVGAEPLDLRTDRPRSPIGSFAGAQGMQVLGGELAEALRDLGRREHCTLFMTLLAGFTVLLNRYTQRDDILLGSPIAGRNRPELEHIIGFFVNMLVLRIDLSGDPTFRQLLQRVRDVSFDAWAHQDLPFEKLVEELHLERDLSRNPLFQIAFQLLNMDRPTTERPGAWGEVHLGVAKFDLTFTLWETGSDIACQIEYSTDLYEPSSIDRMGRHFCTLLKSAVASPDAPISDLELLSPAEREQILADWRSTSRDYPRSSSVDQLFGAQAAQTPEAIALDYSAAGEVEPSRITYAELNHQSGKLANRLRQLGVNPGDAVALLLPPSSALVCAMLAVLKAGAAYVPLDVSFPHSRVQQILADCRARLLLTQTTVAGTAPPPDGATSIVYLDREKEILAEQPAVAPANGATGESISYIMYTSGSSGKPKGVRVPHRAISRLVSNTDYIRLGAQDRIAQASNPAFDAATFEIWGALLNGGCVVGVPRSLTLSPLEFSVELRKRQFTTLFITTALFNAFARRAPGAFQPLQNLLFGGEKADPASVRSVLRNGAPARLVHVYGPTESTTFSLWDLVAHLSEQAASVPLGRPIANTKAVILDRHLRLVPVGCPGELCLGGDGLAIDYLGRPELTAQCFVEWQCPGEPSPEKVYRTGDLVKRLPDGRIDFLRRLDQMVKIRGFRVEPGEVEVLLLRHPLVRHCCVTVREQSDGDKRLVAYVVPQGGWPPPPVRMLLRDYLRERLPLFMIPSAFLAVPELPLNPNGKVDQAKLPDPALASPEELDSFIPPSEGTEQGIAAIWREALQRSQVGRLDNFFDLGGHSLLLVEVQNHIERRFGVSLSITDLFRFPTVGALAQHVDGLRCKQGLSAADRAEANRLREAVERAQRQRGVIKQRFPIA